MERTKNTIKSDGNRDSQVKELVSRMIEHQQKELRNSEQAFLAKIELFSKGKKLILSSSK